MLDRQTAPLEIARKILKPKTINNVKGGGYTNSAYLILDRWALNSPDQLKALEAIADGDELLLRLDQQQTVEKRALISESARQARLRGMSDWEILELAGVETKLSVTGA